MLTGFSLVICFLNIPILFEIIYHTVSWRLLDSNSISSFLHICLYPESRQVNYGFNTHIYAHIQHIQQVLGINLPRSVIIDIGPLIKVYAGNYYFGDLDLPDKWLCGKQSLELILLDADWDSKHNVVISNFIGKINPHLPRSV